MADDNEKQPAGRVLSRRQLIAGGAVAAALPCTTLLAAQVRVQRPRQPIVAAVPTVKRVFVAGLSDDQIRSLRAARIGRPSAEALEDTRDLYAALQKIAADPDTAKQFIENPRRSLTAAGLAAPVMDRRKLVFAHWQEGPYVPENPDKQEAWQVCASVGFIVCVSAGYSK